MSLNRVCGSAKTVLSLFVFLFIYSTARCQDSTPFFLEELVNKEVQLVGRISEGSGSLVYNGMPANEFIMAGDCSNYGHVHPALGRARDNIKELLGQDVLIYGQIKKIDIARLLNENPASQCATDLSALQTYYYYTEAKRLKLVSFYQVSLPDKISWNNNLVIKLEVKNPFKEGLDMLQIAVYSDNKAYAAYTQDTTLGPLGKINLEVSMEPDKPYAGKDYGSKIRLAIYGFSRRENNDYIILFDKPIALYDRHGERQELTDEL